MAKIFAIANRKGGVAKTTTTGALSSGLSRMGYKVLAVDTDPQGNLTKWNGISTEDDNATTIYEVLKGKEPLRNAVVHGKNYDVIPADIYLSNAESELLTITGNELILKKALSSVADEYDFIIIDTPPHLGALTKNAFAAANAGVLVTTDNSRFALEGIGELARTIEAIREFFNPDASVVGILLCKFNIRSNYMRASEEASAAFADYFDAHLFDAHIRQSVAIMECQNECVDLFDITRKNAAIDDYREFVHEFHELVFGDRGKEF